MADDQIAVELVAKTGQLDGGLQDAVREVRDAVDHMHVAFSLGFNKINETIKENFGEAEKEVKEKAESIQETLKKMLLIEQFEAGVEALHMVSEAVEKVKEAFESTVGQAEEFGLANAKFAATMGTTEEHAAGLSAALHGVGSSAEEFEGIVNRLTMRVNQNEKAFQQMGIQTRDASGNLMTGKDLFDSAVRTMESLKAGYDQNAFAAEVFGKRAIDVYNIIRVGDEQVQHQIEIFNEMGVQMTGAGSDAAQLEDALNDLHTMVEALGIKIGQELMPAAQNALQWMGTEGVEFMKQLAEGIAGLSKAVVLFVEDSLHSINKVRDAWKSFTDGFNKTLLPHTSGHSKGLFDNLFPKSTTEIDAQGKAAEEASTAVDHLSSAWDKLLDGFGKMGEPAQTVAESLGALKGTLAGADAALDPLLQLVSKHNPFTPPSGTGNVKRPTKDNGKRDNSDRDILEADEKIALEKIRRAEETNQHLLSMGKETDDEFLARARGLEQDSYDIKLETLNKEMLLPKRTAEEQLKINSQIRELEEQHQTALLKIAQDGETKRAELAKKQVATFLQSLDSELKAYDENEEQLYAAGQISASQRYRAETDLGTSIQRAELAKLDEQIATLKKGTDAYEQATEQRKKIEDKFREEHKKAEEKLRQDTIKDVHATLEPMESAFNSSLKGMLFQGKSFADTMKGLFEGLAESFVDMIVQMAEQWAEKQIVNAIIAEATGGTQSRTQIAASAAAAGAAAYAATVSIPVVGLAAAPGAAAEAYAATLAFQGLVPAARGGMVLDTDQLVFAHQKEMILPANISQGLQGLIAGGQSGGPGGDTTVHVHQTFNATPQKDIRQLMNENPGAVADAIKQLRRDGRL